MKSLLFQIVICMVSLPIYAQSLTASLVAAHNDKSQRAYGPYKEALFQALGSGFREAHGPFAERRWLCKWDGEWVECGYLRLSHASKLTPTQKQTILEVLRRPCKYISFEILNTPQPKYPTDRASFDERMQYAAWSNRKHLWDLCQTGTLDSVAVRIANMGKDERGRLEPATSNDEIGFETRIRVIANEQPRGNKK